MSKVAAGVSASANHRVIITLAVVISDVNVVLLHKVLEALVQVLTIGDEVILGLSILSHVNVVSRWCFDLYNILGK